MKKIKVAIIMNIPAPYRVSFFEYLRKQYTDYDFYNIYASETEDNRKWEVKVNDNTFFLKSKTIKFRQRGDYKYIHIPINIISVLKKIKPDVIVASEYSPTILQAYLFAKIHKIKFVSWTDGTLYSERHINLAQKISRKLIISGANSYIASSTKSFEAQLAYGAKRDKMHKSLLTVDINKYLAKKDNYGTGNLLFVGQLIERKGLDILINSLTKIKNVNYHLYIVGAGPEEHKLKEQVRLANLEEHISFEGFKESNELNYYYNISDIFVLPTREDCFGLVILEAMCHSLPVISSQYADGAFDLIVDGESGYIFDLNKQEDLVNILEKLLINSNLLKNMGCSAYEKSLEFSFEKVAVGYINAIVNLTI
ncbi:MAG TPA: glycosyltransferase family 4 protein [Sedimentibacter sp.]|nr:glycosyltransferase family 4 protein [Sedimentibacter sp.]